MRQPLPARQTRSPLQARSARLQAGELRATHRRLKRKYKTRVRMPSMLDPHVATIEGWLAAEPQLTALAIVGRLAREIRTPSARSSIRSCSGCSRRSGARRRSE